MDGTLKDLENNIQNTFDKRNFCTSQLRKINVMFCKQ